MHYLNWRINIKKIALFVGLVLRVQVRRGVLYRFLSNSKTVGTKMKIYITEGKDLQQFSLLPSEKEYLLLPNSYFKVVEVLPHDSPNQISELDSELGNLPNIDKLFLRQIEPPILNPEKKISKAEQPQEKEQLNESDTSTEMEQKQKRAPVEVRDNQSKTSSFLFADYLLEQLPNQFLASPRIQLIMTNLNVPTKNNQPISEEFIRTVILPKYMNEIFDKTVKKMKEKYYPQLDKIKKEEVEKLAKYVAECMLNYATENSHKGRTISASVEFLLESIEWPNKKLQKLEIQTTEETWDASLIFQTVGYVDDGIYYIRNQTPLLKHNLKYGYAYGKPSKKIEKFQVAGKSKQDADDKLLANLFKK